MEKIKRERIRIQRECGNIVMPLEKKPEEELTISELIKKKSKFKSNCKSENKSDKKNGEPLPKIDGYWKIIQSWSQCTLKCGGGKSYLQRICIPPKNGGKKCSGKSILSKNCNKKPCQTDLDIDIFKSNNQTCTTILKPIVKVMAFSNRPQRYTKCVIKEGDMFLNKPEDTESYITSVNPLDKAKIMSYIKIPVRLIMNNRTLSVFEGEDYNSISNTFLLKSSSFIIDKENKGCFFIKENSRNGNLIKFCSITDNQIDIEKWDYDFNLFKYQCNYNKPEYSYVNEAQEKLKEKISEFKENILNEVQEKNKAKAEENEEKEMEKDVNNCNKVALKAIEKEVNIEELIRKEEILREKKQEEEMIKRIKEEEKRSVNRYIYKYINKYKYKIK